jgi:hypothetical protein
MRRINRWHVNGFLLGLSLWLLLLLWAASGHAATFSCVGGDVGCLSTAITMANANGETNTITLGPGTYTLTTPATLSTGLPVITSTLTMLGSGATQTMLARSTLPGTPAFRLLEVSTRGSLRLVGVTLSNGMPAILTRGALTVIQSTLADNHTLAEGAGIVTLAGVVTIEDSLFLHNVALFGGGGLSVSGGRVTVKRSTFRNNVSQGGGGAIENGVFGSEGEVHIQESAIYSNLSETGSGAILNWTIMEIVNTTIAANGAIGAFTDALGVLNISGTLAVTNSTLTENRTTFTRQPIPALANQGGVVTLANTIIAGNTTDCTGTLTSLEANLIGNPTGCGITLQRRDYTGDPGLSVLQDNGSPGHAHYDLLPTSQALDAGKGSACPKVDQLGQRRTGPCDIGSVSARKTPGALAHK